MFQNIDHACIIDDSIFNFQINVHNITNFYYLQIKNKLKNLIKYLILI